MIRLNIKWGTQSLNDVEVDTGLLGLGFKEQLFSLTNVPVTSQKVLIKGKQLSDEDCLSDWNLQEGQKIMLMGTAEGKGLKDPRDRKKFLENMTDAEKYRIMFKKASELSKVKPEDDLRGKYNDRNFKAYETQNKMIQSTEGYCAALRDKKAQWFYVKDVRSLLATDLLYNKLKAMHQTCDWKDDFWEAIKDRLEESQPTFDILVDPKNQPREGFNEMMVSKFIYEPEVDCDIIYKVAWKIQEVEIVGKYVETGKYTQNEQYNIFVGIQTDTESRNSKLNRTIGHMIGLKIAFIKLQQRGRAESTMHLISCTAGVFDNSNVSLSEDFQHIPLDFQIYQPPEIRYLMHEAIVDPANIDEQIEDKTACIYTGSRLSRNSAPRWKSFSCPIINVNWLDASPHFKWRHNQNEPVSAHIFIRQHEDFDVRQSNESRYIVQSQTHIFLGFKTHRIVLCQEAGGQMMTLYDLND